MTKNQKTVLYVVAFLLVLTTWIAAWAYAPTPIDWPPVVDDGRWPGHPRTVNYCKRMQELNSDYEFRTAVRGRPDRDANVICLIKYNGLWVPFEDIVPALMKGD